MPWPLYSLGTMKKSELKFFGFWELQSINHILSNFLIIWNNLSTINKQKQCLGLKQWWKRYVCRIYDFKIKKKIPNNRCVERIPHLKSVGLPPHCYVAAWMRGGFEGRMDYMYLYGWVPLLSTWSYHNIVNLLYSNLKYKDLKKIKSVELFKESCVSLNYIFHKNLR